MPRMLLLDRAACRSVDTEGAIRRRASRPKRSLRWLGELVICLAGGWTAIGHPKAAQAAILGPSAGCTYINTNADTIRDTVNGGTDVVIGNRFDVGDQIGFFASTSIDSTIHFSGLNLITFDSFSVSAPFGDFSTPTVTIPASGAWQMTFSKTGTLAGMGSLGCTSSFVPTPQTISFADPGAKTLAQSPLALTATATLGLTVSFASTTPAVCTVSGNSATFLGAGTCSIDATQAGNASYAAAAPVTRAFSVTPVCTGTLAPNGIGNFAYSTSAQNFPVAAQLQSCLGANIGPTGSSVTYSSAVTFPLR